MTGHVYFIRPIGHDGPIKIGHSTVPTIRLAQIDIWSPFPLELIGSIPATVAVEGGLHALLKDHHSHGEWFRPAPVVLNAIAGVLSGALDLSTLPAPIDIRAKTGARDKGAGALASLLTRTLVRMTERGAVIPDDVLSASQQFSGPLFEHRTGPRDLNDARIVVRYLELTGNKTPAVAAMLAKVEAA